MRRFPAVFFVFAFCMCNLFGMKKNERLRVASYSSFAGSWGAGATMVSDFENETGIKVELLDLGSCSELFSSVKNGKVSADVILGIDDNQLEDAVSFCVEPKVFDYGFLAFCFDSRSPLTPPGSLLDLEKAEYKNKFALIDPRTSSVGLGLLQWAVAALGDYAYTWYAKVSENALAVCASWSDAYSLFTSGQVPLVISYSTSPVYHYDNGSSDVVSLVFPEGTIKIEEFVSVLKNAQHPSEAGLFVDYVLKNSSKIAISNVMYPVDDKAELTDGYRKVAKPLKVLGKPKAPQLLERWIKELL